MALPDSYTLVPNSIVKYLKAIQGADAPERFTYKFLERLGFKSTNDRTIIAILKMIGFLNAEGVPQQPYHKYLDPAVGKRVLAAGIREAFSDLFAVNRQANTMKAEAIKGKLKTLYAGKKKDGPISRIAKTFVALCEQADFSDAPAGDKPAEETEVENTGEETPVNEGALGRGVSLDSLQYHVNIVLPDTKDQAVFDAIFSSLRKHLG